MGKVRKQDKAITKQKQKTKNMNHDSAKQNRIKRNTSDKQIEIELRILLVDITRCSFSCLLRSPV